MQTATIQGELWGARAEDWTAICEPQTRPLWSGMQEASRVGPGTRYLDLGCGGGTACAQAARKGAIVSGFDASEALLNVARRQVPGGDFRQGDLESLPFQDDAFDVVTAANVVQFVDDKPKALREIRRVMANDAKFVIGMWCEPDRCEMGAVFKAVMEVAPPEGAHEPSLSSRDNLIGLLESSGFSPVIEREVECNFDWSGFDECWRGIRSAGMIEAAARSVGEEPLRAAIRNATTPYQRADGTIRMTNYFRYIVCE